MTTSAFKRLIAQKNLRSIWAAFWKASKKQRSFGVDGVTPAVFEQNWAANLARLQTELERGYKFSNLRGHPIPKPDGRFRIICIPTVSDRIVQRLLADHLVDRATQLGIANSVSFGFIRSSSDEKKGVAAARNRAVELRQSHNWAYKSDISAFFDRIPRDSLLNQTVAALRSPSFSPILSGVIGCEIDAKDPKIVRIAKQNGIVNGLGVRQGMPLSPLFANIILRRFDAKMIDLGVPMVRYADDFIAFADSEAKCREIDRIARAELAKISLCLPPLDVPGSKTRIAEPSEDMDFLGLALSRQSDGIYRLLISEKQMEKIRRTLGNLKDVKQLVADGLSIGDLGRRLDNSVDGYRAAYSSAQNAAQLEGELASIRISVMTSVFTQAFGAAAVSSSKAPFRQFMGLD